MILGLSGGIDSAVLYGWHRNKGERVTPVYVRAVRRGRNVGADERAATAIARHYGDGLVIVDATWARNEYLTVPFALAMATPPGEDCHLGASMVEGVDAFQRELQDAKVTTAVSDLTGFPMRFARPTSRWTKAALIELGRRLKVPLDLTHSCAQDTPCGECAKCLAVGAAWNEVNGATA